ncbi:40S ribosomal protein S4, putative [Plasmodium vivax]|uniref:40S ribosomal protein S4 n=1 Tax=Plasmodium vivax TaxID=5855 RepID=A0A564ZUM5_PLAVI|nr:40S ribosomal protein S4, putative [Plasmodium vivax]
MGKGIKKHMKRVNAPSHWMLNKMGGQYAPKTSSGPHRLIESIPLVILLRNRLKYALTFDEVKMILIQKIVKVDNKIRTDCTFPVGLMDVIHITKSNEYFRLLYDIKGRFPPPDVGTLKERLGKDSMRRFEQCWICLRNAETPVSTPYGHIFCKICIVNHFLTQKKTGKVLEHLKFQIGSMVMVTAGHSVGRVGIISSIDKNIGTYDIIHVKDSRGKIFATRLSNVFVIGDNSKPYISLPREKGIKLDIIEERRNKLKAQNN